MTADSLSKDSGVRQAGDIRTGDVVTLRGYMRRAKVISRYEANCQERTAMIELDRELTGWRRTSSHWRLFDVQLSEITA